MSPLQGLVDATSVALGGARELFGPAAQGSGWSSTAGLGQTSATLRTSVETVPQNWQGPGGEAYQVRGNGRTNAMDFVVDADGQTGPRIVQASNDSRDGRSGINMVMGDTRNGVTAIAPSTDTPAGKQQLVDHLDHQLDRAKLLLHRSEQRNRALANMIRAGGGGYGPRGGGSPMGMGMGGAPAGIGGGFGLPGLSGFPHLGSPGGGGGIFPPTHRIPGSDGPLPPLAGLDRPGIANETRLQKFTRRINRAITAAFPQISDIGGYRQDSLKWHPNGLALDVMIPNWDTPQGKALGDRIVAFVTAHKDELGFDHALWRQAEHDADGSVTPMGPRNNGSPNDNHFNHVHIASKGGGYDGY